MSTSTGGAIYGATTVVPTSEDVPADPLATYGLSKLTAERFARWSRRIRGLDVGSVRYGNVYSLRQDPRSDVGVIAIFCDVVAANLAAAMVGELPPRRPPGYGAPLPCRRPHHRRPRQV